MATEITLTTENNPELLQWVDRFTGADSSPYARMKRQEEKDRIDRMERAHQRQIDLERQKNEHYQELLSHCFDGEHEETQKKIDREVAQAHAEAYNRINEKYYKSGKISGYEKRSAADPLDDAWASFAKKLIVK